MLVFIDESGDSGFKLSKGSSPVFVIALVIFDDNLVAEEVSLAVKKLRREIKFPDNTEFHYQKSRHHVKEKFLQTIAPFNYKIRSIVVKKKEIYSNFLRTSTDSFYNYIVMQVIKHSQQSLQSAKLKFDSHGEKKIRDELRVYLSRQLDNKNSHFFSDLKFVDSKQNALIQVADMVAGCIAAYHKGKDTELYKIIKKRIESDWEFKWSTPLPIQT